MRRPAAWISKVLYNLYTVLLQGETGTAGRGGHARAIRYGPRRAQALVVQNCAAFPENLLKASCSATARVPLPVPSAIVLVA